MIDLAPAAMRLVLVHLMLAILGAPRTRRLIERGEGRATDRDRAERFARAIQRAARRLPLRTNCLDQALALTWMLRADGMQAALRFGVRHGTDGTDRTDESHRSHDHRLIAHAWVEHAGEPLLDDAPMHYTPLQ
ncbi:MAG TPA: lasso peptide biosynthesis B2 protein [Thermoanaerobaculia bacterium]|nr:lasso peptide biosynthesis B2 protein [Thermoanaerobaculia bacterium]